MSSSVQNKLLSVEATPPPGVWEKITAELDEADLEHKYPAALYGFSATPPSGTWEKIVARLDIPAVPAETITEKLYALETAPPVTAWNKIKIALDAEHEAAIPEHRRLSPLLRYAAAAVVIGLLTWGGISLFNNKQADDTVAKKELPALEEIPIAPAASTESASVTTDNITENTPTAAIAQAEEARNDAALEASKKTFAKLDIQSNSRIKEAANFYFGQAVSSGTTRGLDLASENPDYTPETVKEANRYIMLITPEGNIIRMSKKLSNLICCVSGEEQDKECKDQMKKWREKIACSPAAHSPGNFMDILSLANSLQEENEF
jgi:hypothetical protein